MVLLEELQHQVIKIGVEMNTVRWENIAMVLVRQTSNTRTLSNLDHCNIFPTHCNIAVLWNSKGYEIY